jgi:hypothetical protein
VSLGSALDAGVFAKIDSIIPVNMKLSFNYSRSLIKVIGKFNSAKIHEKEDM